MVSLNATIFNQSEAASDGLAGTPPWRVWMARSPAMRFDYLVTFTFLFSVGRLSLVNRGTGEPLYFCLQYFRYSTSTSPPLPNLFWNAFLTASVFSAWECIRTAIEAPCVYNVVYCGVCILMFCSALMNYGISVVVSEYSSF